MRSATSLGALALAAAVLAGCGGGAPANSPQVIADTTTSAVYRDDPSAIQTHFDDQLRGQVTLDQIAALSAKLHALGDYHGLQTAQVDPAKNRYDFTARFGDASIPVHLRLDPDGRIAAYRLDLPEAPSR